MYTFHEYLRNQMMPTISPFTALICAPICIVTACVAKLIYRFTRFKPFDISRKAYIENVSKYFKDGLRDGLASVWTLNGKIHVLCRYSTIFADEPPIIIIHGPNARCSLDYVEFMKSIPKHRDVFCIDLPGWGISEPLLVDLDNDALFTIYNSYATAIYKTMIEFCPIDGQKFVLIGDSFGSCLITHAIASGIIPANKIVKCILCSMPGISKNTFRNPRVKSVQCNMGIMDALFNSWWAPHLCCALLFERRLSLTTLRLLQKFVPDKQGHKLVARNITSKAQWSYVMKQSLDIVSNNVAIILVNGSRDSVVDCKHARMLCEESGNNIKYIELWTGHDVFNDECEFAKILDVLCGDK
jgi:pimeloyl-ACP methyl ester carboxylesterase